MNITHDTHGTREYRTRTHLHQPGVALPLFLLSLEPSAAAASARAFAALLAEERCVVASRYGHPASTAAAPFSSSLFLVFIVVVFLFVIVAAFVIVVVTATTTTFIVIVVQTHAAPSRRRLRAGAPPARRHRRSQKGRGRRRRGGAGPLLAQARRWPRGVGAVGARHQCGHLLPLLHALVGRVDVDPAPLPLAARAAAAGAAQRRELDAPLDALLLEARPQVLLRRRLGWCCCSCLAASCGRSYGGRGGEGGRRAGAIVALGLDAAAARALVGLVHCQRRRCRALLLLPHFK